jgi:hypothetical protein
VPEAAVVQIDAGFLEANPDAAILFGSRRVPAEVGWHYGSRFPGDPARLAVFDFLPDVLLPNVVNLKEFTGVLVFDKWAGNSDARQSIYYRAKSPPGPAEEEPGTGFVAMMVDHGYVFDGPHWSFVDSPLQGFYFRPRVYETVRGWNDFEPWLGRVRHFPVEVMDSALKQLPREWIAGEEDELERLLEKLLARCRTIERLIEDARTNRTGRFPNWK